MRRSRCWPSSLTIAAGLGIIVGSVFLMPAVTALVASFFVDDIALAVERSRYPGEPEGKPLPLLRAVIEGVTTALLAVAVYLVALPFLLLAGFGALIFFVCTAYILGREYFELAAMRYRPVAEARALRKRHRRHGVRGRPVHRRLRVDPGGQSGDPAVRHGVHGAHAQAPVGRASAADRDRARRRRLTGLPKRPKSANVVAWTYVV